MSISSELASEGSGAASEGCSLSSTGGACSSLACSVSAGLGAAAVLDNNGDILGYLEFKTKFDVPLTNFLVYQGVAQGIKHYMKETKK